MCSKNDFHYLQNELINVDNKINHICNKCGTNDVVIMLQKKHCYCFNCFLQMVNHKFRSTLGKIKVMKYGNKVLVPFFGDLSSIALLQLIKNGISDKSSKRLKLSPVVIFIDESALWPKNINKNQILNNVREILNNFSHEWLIFKLSSLYEKCLFYDTTSITNTQEDNDLKLISLFDEVTTATSKIELLYHLRYLLLMKIAHKYECQIVFTPECGTELSVNLLSNITLGRGSHIYSYITVYDERYPNLIIVRPLKEITIKEIAFYNVFHKLFISVIPSAIFMFKSEKSVQETTLEFVYDHQENFPSTVFTIRGIGDKLMKNENYDEKKNLCLFCFNNKPVNLKEVNILVDSRHTSSDDKLCISNEKSCKCDKHNEILNNKIEILPYLCYSCRRIINDMISLDNLPHCITENAYVESNSEKLRREIEEFIL